MMKGKTRYITTTAVFLALAVAFQSLRLILPASSIFGLINVQQLVIGCLVNLTIFLSAWLVGFWSAAALSVLTPFIAFFQGAVPIVPMIAAIAIGNLTLSLFAYLLRDKRVISLIIASVAKFSVLFALVTYVVIPVFVSAPAIKTVLSAGFSWPQLITGLGGGILATAIFPPLKNSLQKR